MIALAALLATKDASCFEHGDQGGTFNGNPLMCAAGLAVLEEISKPEFLKSIADAGLFLESELQKLSARHGLGEVRGRGLLLALDLKLPIGASIVAHLATFTAFLFAAYALGVRVPLVDFFAIMPIERTISALPISFAGIGLREKVLQIMLNGLCGVPEAKAILIGSLSFVIILVCCLPGAFVYLFYKPSGAAEHVKLREMEKEVVTLEHELGEPE